MHHSRSSPMARTCLKDVSRKSPNRIIRVALRWTSQGKRKQYRQKTTLRRTVEKEIKAIGRTVSRWNRARRRSRIIKIMSTDEANSNHVASQKCDRWYVLFYLIMSLMCSSSILEPGWLLMQQSWFVRSKCYQTRRENSNPFNFL